jgi:choline dehydrogenase-like flavoprotein
MSAPGQDEHDVVIVGSGAGGGATAWALCNHKIRVLVLEAGPAYDPLKDYHLDRNDWEETGFPYKAGSRGTQSFAALQGLEERWKGLRSWNHHYGQLFPGDQRSVSAYHHVRGVGGSTLHFTGEAHRLHPDAMKMHSRFGVAADWPLDYAELEPHYCTAERIIGVAGPLTEKVRTRSEPYPLPPHKPSYASQRLGEGCRKLGLRWDANPVAALSAPYDGRPPCNYCANCNRGCPRLDKGSVDITFVRKALDSGFCTLRSGAVATRVEAGADDRVTAVHYIDAGGNARKVSARAVVIACGAVETPRLLLLSGNRHAPDGLANESGQVGRHFMETLFWTSSGLHPEPLGSHRGHPSDSICWDFNAPDAIPGVVGGCRFSPATAEAGMVGPIMYAQRVVDGWGKAHKDRLRMIFGRVLSIGAIGENLPNPGSYVDLDPVERDAAGLSVARIHSHVEESELRRLEFMARTCREILRAAGVGTLFEEYGSYDTFSATHVFGTCRMGNDPRQSVVDRDCRSHRWRNLYVVDASVFPSSGGGESPSLTIEALAIRTAGQMARAMKQREL